MTILVLGATGKTGRRVVRRLRERGIEVRAGSRKAEPPFDWTDPGTWTDVLRGASAVYLVVPEEPEPIAPFVQQAVEAGVTRFVALSGRGGQFDEHFGAAMGEGERAVRESGAEWAVIRANNFAQNFDEDLWYAPLLAGRLALPAQGILEPFVDVEDIAEVAAVLLTDDGRTGRAYEVSGPEAFSFEEAVARISAASGRPIEYVDVSPAEYAEELRAQGCPEEAVGSLVALFDLLRTGIAASPADGVPEVLGRPATPFADYVARVWSR